MRDAFGGAFLIKVFLVFIMIYICFTALAINYAKAFKVKNAVVDYLESNEITTLDNLLSATEMNQLDDFINYEILGKMNYNLSSNDICSIGGAISTTLVNDEGKAYGYCHNSGIKIEIAGEGQNTEGVYYTVSTYIGWSMPFLNTLLSLGGNSRAEDVPIGMWQISGQTRLIVNQ